MRIISGKYKGFRFPPHQLKQTRPTTDRAKESLFNILMQQYDFDEVSSLDLYAGTGNISFELISRGVQTAHLVEHNYKCVTYIKSVAEKLDANIVVYKNRVLKQIPMLNHRYDLIFADPPYQSPDYLMLIDSIRNTQILNTGGSLILEHPTSMSFNQQGFKEKRVYGQSTFSFFTFD